MKQRDTWQVMCIRRQQLGSFFILLLCVDINMYYPDVTMSALAPQITSFTVVYSTVYSGADQRKHQSSASLASVRGIHRWPVNYPHKRPVRQKMFPFDDVTMDNDVSFIMSRQQWSAVEKHAPVGSIEFRYNVNQNSMAMHETRPLQMRKTIWIPSLNDTPYQPPPQLYTQAIPCNTIWHNVMLQLSCKFGESE